MTRKLLTTVAAGALFATAFAPAAFSQTAQPASPATPTTQMAPADNAAPKVPDVTAPTGDAAQAPAPAATTDTADAGSYLTTQAPDQISANTYIGQSVYNGANESIGSVNDLIMKKDGGIVAAIIGVGGFLGIGEKNVAVPMEKITVAQNTEDGSVKLTTSETVDSLKAAPEFKTLSMQSAEKAPAPSSTMPTDSTSTGSTTAK